MTTRNLDRLFSPSAIALIGASARRGSVGAVLARNLVSGGFAGPIMLVNPKPASICGINPYTSIAALPQTPDLAIIATPAPTVPQIVEELAARGCRAAIIISAGLDAAQRQAVFDAARPRLMRIVGPNCLGFLSPHIGVNASFAHLAPLKGEIALVTQSGAIATSMIDWANGKGLGFSHILSIGDMSDVDFGDLLDHLALDAETKAILLYIETITSPRKFMSAARIAARTKPVIVVKAGRGQAGARAAASHTGALTGADIVFDAAFRRAGMLRVDELRDLFDAAQTLASGVHIKGDRLAILTNGGGLGVIAADALEAKQGSLALLSPAATDALSAALPTAWSHANPIDILGDAGRDRYSAALDALVQHGDQDAILLLNCPTGVGDNLDAAEAAAELKRARPEAPLIACWMGGATTNAPRQALSQADVPNFETPEEAVRAFLQLRDYAANQAALLQTPTAGVQRSANARSEAAALIAGVIAEGRTLLTEPESKRILALYGVPVVETLSVASGPDAAAAAKTMEGPLALKILSRDITHKSDVGGVALGLEDADEVAAAAVRMLQSVRAAAPAARIDGFTLQPMIARPMGHELIIGLSEDRTFGPVILFGHGGVAAERIADRVIGLPPLNEPLAQAMIARTRVAKLLAGYRDRPPANLLAIAQTLIAVADLAIDIPDIAELDINPLIADARGVIALDARFVVRTFDGDPASRLAIRPYPTELVRDIRIGNGAVLLLRPIRPEDAPALAAMGERMAPEHLRFRFHGAVRTLNPEASAPLTQIDYDREMALIAFEGNGAAAGVARLGFDPDFAQAEYAIVVRSDMQGQGLGRALMRALILHAQERGAQRLWGDVMADNHSMLTMAREMGAQLSFDVSQVRTEFDLSCRTISAE